MLMTGFGTVEIDAKFHDFTTSEFTDFLNIAKYISLLTFSSKFFGRIMLEMVALYKR